MSVSEFEAAVADRLANHAIDVSPAALSGCAGYLQLLAKWNRTINLTAMSLSGTADERSAAIDKLVIEPLIAARLLQEEGVGSPKWCDLGSGGGSPAIPLRVVMQGGDLTMIESRERKCAFLREAVRALRLPRTHVLASRFEAVGGISGVTLVSVRAVRLDEAFVDFAYSLMDPDGFLLLFGAALSDDRFAPERVSFLPDGSRVTLLRRVNVPRGT